MTHNLNFSSHKNLKISIFSPKLSLTSVLHKILTKICEKKYSAKLFLRTDGLSLFPADLPSSGSFHFLPAETTFPGGKMNFSLTQNCADFNRCPFGSAWSLGRAMSIDEIRTHD
jgi:hypothetical protein